MSLALIQESAKEARRLAIAGSPLAVGDFRLKKLVAPMEQAGAKVPVFAQVAKAIGDLVNGREADSAANLLNLSTLLNAILYTQGQSGAEGDYRELEAFATTCSSTRTPARMLKPLVQALTTTGGGRFEIVKSACERGAFNDLRLIDPAIQALGDIYPELADLVAKKILPIYGPGIVPRLKATMDIKGKKQDARKLGLMHQLDPAGTLELCKTALEDGSPEVKAAAIACLGKHEECLPLVLEQANAKNKLLRAAALEALAEHDRPEITKLFTELIQCNALDILAGPFRALRNRQILNSLLAEGKRVFDLILKGDEEQIPRYWEILDCLGHRKEPEVEEFVLTCFGQGDRVAKLKGAKNSNVAGADLIVRLTSLLYGMGLPKTLGAILAKHGALPPLAFGYVLRSALRTWPADKIYQEFSPLLGQTKGAGKEKNFELQRNIRAGCRGGAAETGYFEGAECDSDGALTPKSVEWDARWLDAAIKADELDIVCCLARPAHKRAVTYLVNAIDSKNRFQTDSMMEALARCQYSKITDVFLDQVTKRTKNAGAFHHEFQVLLNSARHLPATDLPRLEKFAAKLDEKYIDGFLEALAPLRPTHQPS
jgi:HEAT repeats